MGKKTFSIIFDEFTLNKDGMWHRIITFEDDLKGELVWREKIADVSGYDDGEGQITISVKKKSDFAKVVKVIETNIKHHLSVYNFFCKDDCYEFERR